jgi:hypothetical protein
MNRWTKTRHYEWAEQWGDLLDALFPQNHEAVAATCRVELRGKLSHRGEGKKAYATAYYAMMQSFGEIPAGFTGVQTRGNWIQTTNRESLDAIMSAFGLTFDDLLSVVGMPEDAESREVALHDIVVGCDAEFATKPAAAASVA